MEGDCVEISDMKCNRTCDGTRFPVNRVDYILLEVGHGINWERIMQESLYSGREGGFGEMPKGFDWRNTPPPNLGSWQTQVITLHQLFRQGVVLWCLENWCNMQDAHPGQTGNWCKMITWQTHQFVLTFVLRLNKLVAACSDIRVNKEMRSIEVTTTTTATSSTY